MQYVEKQTEDGKIVHEEQTPLPMPVKDMSKLSTPDKVCLLTNCQKKKCCALREQNPESEPFRACQLELNFEFEPILKFSSKKNNKKQTNPRTATCVVFDSTIEFYQLPWRGRLNRIAKPTEFRGCCNPTRSTIFGLF